MQRSIEDDLLNSFHLNKPARFSFHKLTLRAKHVNFSRMQNLSLGLFSFLGLCTSFSGAIASPLDIPFYDFAAQKTLIFFVEGDAVFKAPCPANKPINARDLCDLTRKRKLFNLSEASDYFIQGLKKINTPDNVLAPLTKLEVQTLINDAANDPKLTGLNSELQAQASDVQSLLARFGEEPSLRQKLNEVNAKLATLKVLEENSRCEFKRLSKIKKYWHSWWSIDCDHGDAQEVCSD